MNEEPCRIESGGGWLSGMLHRPAGNPAGSVLICNPLFEERKSAHRLLVETARAFCEAGFGVLRFDYRGCGDSGGEFPDFTVSDWLTDIRAASGFLRDRFPGKSAGILGLRLGATFALKAIADPGCKRFDFAVLWEPVVSGRDYLDQELRKKLMKEMMTFGKSRCTREALEADLKAGREIDFDGHPITPALHRDLCVLDACKAQGLPPLKNLIIGIGPSARPSRPLTSLHDALQAAGSACELRMAVEPPIWSLVGLVACPALIRQTRDWMTQAAGAV